MQSKKTSEKTTHAARSPVRIPGLQAGEDVKKRKLFDACRQCDAEAVMASIASGADVNAKDSDGRTPLHWAAQNGHDSTAMILIEAGGDVNAKDYLGRTPMHWAAWNGHTSTAMILIDAGADVDADVDATDKRYRTPAALARRRNHESTALAIEAAIVSRNALASVRGHLGEDRKVLSL